MKQIIITLTTLLLVSTNVYATKNTLDHTNPMPNLVRYVIANADLIQLKNEQKMIIKAWSSVNKPRVKMLKKEIILQEKELLIESLAGDANILEQSESIFDKRREVIKIKTQCRAQLKDILTPWQYSLIVDLYKEEYYKETKIII